MKKERKLQPVEIKFLRVEIERRDNLNYYAVPIYEVRQCEIKDQHLIPAESREYRGESFERETLQTQRILDAACNLIRVVEAWAHVDCMESDEILRGMFQQIVVSELLTDDARNRAKRKLEQFTGKSQ